MGQYMSSASNPKQEDVWAKREDVLIIVLSRLPVKTLLQCSFVCKTWYLIIFSRSFATTHLTYQKQPTNTNKFILFQDSGFCTLLTDPYILFDSTKQSRLHYTPQSFGRDHGRCSLKVHGICDGLFCLSNNVYRVGDDIHLWNPICRKAKKLPELRYSTEVAYGSVSFGHHDDDYKVVVISPSDFIYTVCVYSLSTNCWKIIHHFMYFKSNTDGFSPIHPTKFVDGSAYMITMSGRILSYDLQDDIIRQFDCPKDSYWYHNEVQNFQRRLKDPPLHKDFTMEVYGETIAVFGKVVGVPPCSPSSQLAMWILRDKSSSTPTWEKKLVVASQKDSRATLPVGFGNKGQYLIRSLFFEHEKFFLWDLESSKVTEVRSVQVFHEHLSSVEFSSVESLLLLNEDTLDPFVQEGSSCSSILFALHNASNQMHQGNNKKGNYSKFRKSILLPARNRN